MTNLEVGLITAIVTTFTCAAAFYKDTYYIDKKLVDKNTKIMLSDGSFWVKEQQDDNRT